MYHITTILVILACKPIMVSRTSSDFYKKFIFTTRVQESSQGLFGNIHLWLQQNLSKTIGLAILRGNSLTVSILKKGFRSQSFDVSTSSTFRISFRKSAGLVPSRFDAVNFLYISRIQCYRIFYSFLLSVIEKSTPECQSHLIT